MTLVKTFFFQEEDSLFHPLFKEVDLLKKVKT